MQLCLPRGAEVRPSVDCRQGSRQSWVHPLRSDWPIQKITGHLRSHLVTKDLWGGNMCQQIGN